MGFTKRAKKIITLFRIPSFLIVAMRFLVSPREQLDVWRDYRALQHETTFIRAHSFVCSPSKTALFVLASGMVYETKAFAMLALGLMMDGWHIVVVSSRSYTWSVRYFRLFGINHFVYFDDIQISPREKSECSRAVQEFFNVPLTFKTIKEWKYRGAWIGPQILATASRSTMQGTPDVKDPAVKKHIKELLPDTLATVRRAQHLIDSIHPQMIVVNEANYALMGALVDTAIAEHITVIQAIQPVRDDAFIFKKLSTETRRSHPASVSVETMHEFANLSWTSELQEQLDLEFKNRYGGKWFLQARNQPGVKQKNKTEIIQQLSLDPHKKIAVIFSPILWDANLFYGDDLFEDYGDWFVQTVRAACKNPHLNWIIKLHPANAWKRARENVTSEFSEVTLTKKEIGELPPHVTLLYPTTDISTWSLFEIADYGITVRGTIGMELPCLGIPVFTAGTGRYSGLGFTNDSQSKEEYLGKLAHIQEFGRLSPEETLQAKRHAYIAFQLRPWIMKSFKAVFKYKKHGVHPLDHNLFLTAHSFGEIEQNGDLHKWAVWAAAKDKVDYLDKVTPSTGHTTARA